MYEDIYKIQSQTLQISAKQNVAPLVYIAVGTN